MAATLLIRNLPKKVTDALKAYKELHDIKVNTDAACEMIARYPKLDKEIDDLRAAKFLLERKYKELAYQVRRYAELKQESESFLNLAKEMVDED